MNLPAHAVYSRYSPTHVRGVFRSAHRRGWPCVLLSAVVVASQGCTSHLATLPDSSFGSHVSVASGKRVQKPSRADVLPVSTDSRATVARRAYRSVELMGAAQATSTQNPDLPAVVDSGIVHTGGPSQAQGPSAPDDTFSMQAVSAPLSALLFSLASDASLQLDIKGSVDQRVTLNSVDQPLDNVLNSLAEQGSFTWQRDTRVLRVWSGEAYSHTYPVNYLNMRRRTQSSVGLATQVGTINATDASGSSIANSSQTLVENASEHDFWDSLSNDIAGLMRHGTSLADSLGEDAGISEYSLNQEAGLLTLLATPVVHRRIQSYLSLLHQSSQRQVLIEATVVEVALSDTFSAGVDWQMLANGVSGINAAQILVGAPQLVADTVNRLASPAGIVSLVQQGSQADVRVTLSLLEQFGDVRILSRPRIIALNNQSAVLKVVDNRVYFTVNVQRRQSEDNDEIVTETEIHTVPVGLVMNVTPQISEHNVVMLNVRPTLSRILGFVDDPNPELALANVRNGVPEIQVREMESMLQVRSGDVAIIGGLMQETHSDNDARLPGLGKLPFLGRLFASERREHRQTELLIVLRPTVISSAVSLTGKDR